MNAMLAPLYLGWVAGELGLGPVQIRSDPIDGMRVVIMTFAIYLALMTMYFGFSLALLGSILHERRHVLH
jgi:hypothetical protein